MIPIKMVSVPKNAFKFCSASMLLIFFAALIFQNKALVLAGLAVLLASVVLRLERAPFIVLYQLTLGKVRPSEKVYFDEHAILFAHGFAAVLAALASALLYYVNEPIGWGVVFILILAKTSAFYGYCGAAKLYSCLNSDNSNCCRFGSKVKSTCRLDK